MRRLAPARVLASLLAVPAGAFACSATGAVSPTVTGEASVLFIGNSLTAANDLPARVADVAAASGRKVRTSAVTLSGASLADHWQDGRALRAIRGGGWDVVALQQGPSTLPESRAELIASTRQFAAEIRRAGGRPALLMIWPLPGQAASAVSASYRAAAEANDALLLAAGDAWTVLAARDPSVTLVEADGYHPSLLGTIVAAATVECTLAPQERPRLPAVIGGLALDAGRRALVIDAACAAAAGNGR